MVPIFLLWACYVKSYSIVILTGFENEKTSIPVKELRLFSLLGYDCLGSYAVKQI